MEKYVPFDVHDHVDVLHLSVRVQKEPSKKFKIVRNTNSGAILDNGFFVAYKELFDLYQCKTKSSSLVGEYAEKENKDKYKWNLRIF